MYLRRFTGLSVPYEAKLINYLGPFELPMEAMRVNEQQEPRLKVSDNEARWCYHPFPSVAYSELADNEERKNEKTIDARAVNRVHCAKRICDRFARPAS